MNPQRLFKLMQLFSDSIKKIHILTENMFSLQHEATPKKKKKKPLNGENTWNINTADASCTMGCHTSRLCIM
jgi:hypothetical protein